VVFALNTQGSRPSRPRRAPSGLGREPQCCRFFVAPVKCQSNFRPEPATANPLYKFRSRPVGSIPESGCLGWECSPETGFVASRQRRDRNSSKRSFKELLVEAVGIEPTSEELQSPVSPCAAGWYISPGGRSAGGLPRGPARKISVTVYGRHGGPAHLTSSIPDRRAEPREGRGYLSSQCVVVVGS